MKRRFYLMILVLANFNILFSQTTVSGNVFGTWNSSGNPYYVTGDILVPEGKSLTIEEGVELYFTGTYSFSIDGLLQANGSESNIISIHGDGGAGSWRAIYFSEKADGNSKLSYCLIRDGGYDQDEDSENTPDGIIYIYNNSKGISIENCEISNSLGHGIYILSKLVVWSSEDHNTRQCLANIRYNKIHNNHYNGIFVYAYYKDTGDGARYNKSINKPLLEKNEIYDNSRNGIECSSFSDGGSSGGFDTGIIVKCNPKIIKNTIHGNQENGIVCFRTKQGFYYGSNTIETKPLISTNIFSNNIFFGIDGNNHVPDDSVKHNDIWNNQNGNFDGLGSALGVNSRKNINGDSCDVNSNILFDPEYQNEIDFDFTLQQHSKCIDAGDLNLEYDPDGTFSDIGANFYDQREAVLSVSPSELDFGQVLIGESTSQTSTVKNDGNGVLDVTSISITGADSANFSADNTLFSLNPGESRDIEVTYTPESVKNHFATLEIESNGGDASVSLEGSGTYTIFTKIEDAPVFDDEGRSLASSWADYDNDGDMDLFVANSDGQNNFLYNNNGDGTFSKMESGPVVNDGGNSQGCTWGDYNNDGFVDLFVSNVQNENNFLYKNNGNGTFTKITNGSIVEDGGVSIGCAWGDYNNDGYLDLYVANGDDQGNFLYKNNGDETFTKITEGDIVTDQQYSVGCAWADYNNDHYLDLFVSNVKQEQFNKLYINNGDGTFSEDTHHPAGTKTALGGSWGDYENDGDLDLYITRLGNNSLFRNNGDEGFTEITEGPLVNDHGDSRGSCWADFDNDGDLDLFVSNTANHDTVRNTNVLYFNLGDGTFVEEINGSIVTDSSASYSPSAADYDNDGDIDLFVCSYYDPYNNLFYQNQGNDYNWINILCKGELSRKSAIGAKVLIKATIFGKSYWQLREISSQTGGGQSSQNSLNAEFGLGDASIIDSIKVKWPSGRINVLTDVAVNQFLTINENNQPYVSSAIPDTSFDEDTGPHIIVDHLDSVFTDPDDDDLTYSSASDNEHIVSTINNDTLMVEADSDYFGQGQIIVTATDDGGLSVNDTFMVEILPVDDPPFPFSLIAPVDGDTLESMTQPLTFVWESSQEVDGDTLRYRLHVFDNGYDTTFIDLADTSYTINDPSFLSDNWTYQWTVLANDQHSIVSADTFSFVTPKTVDIAGFENGIPKQYELSQNYPNPFNPETRIKFGLPKASHVKLEVFNMLGQRVAVLLDGHKPAGYHEVTFDGSQLSSGVYYYRIQAGDFAKTLKMLLIR